ncbi:MAG: Crp/Fnr family transcriptional regulator [Cyanobacteria bacterium J06648_11]
MSALVPEPLQSVAKPRRLAAGDVLFCQGDRARAVYAIATGRIRLARYGADGCEVTLYRARAGEYLAEAALFADRYYCHAIADIPSEAIAISKTTLLNYLHANPQVGMDWLERATREVHQLRTHLELRNIPTARDRLLHFLALTIPFADRDYTFDRPWKAIASELGLTHDSLYRALAVLERQGRIQRNGRCVKLL